MVEERYEYDLLGRVTKRSVYYGTTEVESTSTDYFVTAANAITTRLTGDAVITNTVDGLGRTTQSETDPQHPNATKLVTTTLYDREDNVANVTDGKAATARAYDSVHRARKTLSSGNAHRSDECRRLEPHA
jgi:hypothetical protein